MAANGPGESHGPTLEQIVILCALLFVACAAMWMCWSGGPARAVEPAAAEQPRRGGTWLLGLVTPAPGYETTVHQLTERCRGLAADADAIVVDAPVSIGGTPFGVLRLVVCRFPPAPGQEETK